jgi:hypothetical protein
MRIKIISGMILTVICFVFFSTQAFSANDENLIHAQRVIFGGVGSADKGNPQKSDKTPWALGFLYRGDESSKLFMGFDVAGEGTSLDNTSGKNNEVGQGISFNILLGMPLNFSKDWQAGVGALLGMRKAGQSCPSGDSYLGYQCYADEEPEADYDFNYGAVFHLYYKHALLGLRVSGESTQILLGVAF